MRFTTLTDKGVVRQTNEDSVYVSENRFGHVLAIVADGMGGHNAGEIASKLAVTTLGKAWSVVDHLDSINDAKKWLTDQIHTVNKHVLMYSEADESFSGMGTTLVIAIVIGDKTLFANVGDSRAYIYGKDELMQVTSDHTLVNTLVEKGEIDLEQAKYHPQKNIIMQAVGTSVYLQIDFYETVNNYEYILLCSDGLNDAVDDEAIAKVLKNKLFHAIPKELVDMSNSNGGYDNISIVLLEVGE